MTSTAEGAGQAMDATVEVAEDEQGERDLKAEEITKCQRRLDIALDGLGRVTEAVNRQKGDLDAKVGEAQKEVDRWTELLAAAQEA